MRTRTPPRDNGTSRTITVQRACNGCYHLIGDVTETEIDRSIAGLPLPDVRHECPWCAPFNPEDNQETP